MKLTACQRRESANENTADIIEIRRLLEAAGTPIQKETTDDQEKEKKDEEGQSEELSG